MLIVHDPWLATRTARLAQGLDVAVANGQADDVDAARLWRDPAMRAAALHAILDTWEHGDQAKHNEAIRRVDRAVILGLAALGIPRGPVTARRFERVDRGYIGRKEPGCDLVFDVGAVHDVLHRDKTPDDVFCTWIHESIHARQPYADGHRRESATVRGYEEGLAEGMARLVIAAQPGMTTGDRRQGAYYVAAYEEFAAVVRRPVEEVWNLLWPAPVGRLRERFRDILPQFLGRPTTGSRILLMSRRADSIFATSQAQRQEFERIRLRQQWEEVLV